MSSGGEADSEEILQAQFQRGLQLAEEGDYGAAEDQLLPLAGGGYARAMTTLARVYMAVGDLDEAERWYQRAVDLGRSHAMFGLGTVFRARGVEEAARLWFQQADDAVSPWG
jgi:Tfp pilus assembly protein PilF